MGLLIIMSDISCTVIWRGSTIYIYLYIHTHTTKYCTNLNMLQECTQKLVIFFITVFTQISFVNVYLFVHK